MALPSLGYTRFQKPPVGRQIDWNHPKAAGLCFATVFNEEQSSTLQNLVTGKTGALSGTAKPDWLAGRPGGLRFNGNTTPGTSYVDYGSDRDVQDLTLHTDGSTPVSILYRVWVVGATNCGVIERNNGNVSKGWSAGLISGVTPNFTWVAGTADGQFRSGVPIATGKWQTVALVWNGQSNPSTSTPACKIYVNGKDTGAFGAFQISSGTLVSDSTEALRLGRQSIASNGSLNGFLDYVYVWRNRMLSLGEVMDFEEDPYAFFDNPLSIERLPIAIVIGGSGGVTIGAPSISGSGTESDTGSGGVTIGAPSVSGAGDVIAPADARITQTVAEVFGAATPVARVTGTWAEVFGSKPVFARISQTVIEVFGVAVNPPPLPPGYGNVNSGDVPTDGTSLCGASTPLLFCELQKDTGSSFFSWVDQPLNDPTSQKQPRITNVSKLRRALSDWTGRYDVAHGDVTLTDYDGAIRAMIASNTIVRKQIDFYFIDDVNRRAGVTPLRVGSYLISDYDLNGDMTVKLSFEARLGGESADSTLQKNAPYRTLDTVTFPNLPSGLIGKREPIPYGILSDERATAAYNPIVPTIDLTLPIVTDFEQIGDGVPPAGDLVERHVYISCVSPAGVEGRLSPEGGNFSYTPSGLAVPFNGFRGNPAVASYRIYVFDGAGYNPQTGGGTTTYARLFTHDNVTVNGGFYGKDFLIECFHWTDGIDVKITQPTVPVAKGTVQVNYVGTRVLLDGNSWYEGLIAGCATWGPVSVFGSDGNTPPQRVRMPVSAYSTDIVFPDPTQGQWTALTGATTKYRVINGKRYTVIYFKVGSAIGEAFANNTVPVLVNMGGIEETGDGTGRVITSIPKQVQHFLTNFVVQNHNTDANWYAIPTTGSPAYAIVDSTSFDDTHTIATTRVSPDGYVGAFIIGADLNPTPIGDCLQRMCLAGDFNLGTDRHGRERASMEDTTKASVKDFTIVPNIFKGSYTQKKDRSLLANVVSAWTFKNYAGTPPTGITPPTDDRLPAAPSGQTDWLTAQLDQRTQTSIAALGGSPVGEREFHYEDWITRDFTLLVPNNVIAHELTRRTAGPDFHTFTTDLCGFDVDLGDVFTVTHFAGLVPTTRRLRCMSVELQAPDPNAKSAFGVTLIGHDITDL